MSEVSSGDFFSRQYNTISNGFTLVLDAATLFDESQVLREGTVTVSALGLERTFTFKLAAGFSDAEVDALLADEERAFLLHGRITRTLRDVVTYDCEIERITFAGATIFGAEVSAA